MIAELLYTRFMLITVFTPTYNRAHLLERLHESLCKQTYHDFEWLIVDDGSTDGTSSLFQRNNNGNDNENGVNSHCPTFNSQFSIPNSFKIRYFYQENGGKHRAINRGVKEAKGELFFIADSDDVLPENALETVAEKYEDIRHKTSYAGVCGLDGAFDGKVIGSGLPKDEIDDNSITVRFKLGVKGDMKEVFRTKVLKEFPFPEIDGERFCPEVLVWNRIATKYKLRYFNQIIYLAEYQSDGITAGIVRARMQSPIASMMTYGEMTMFQDVPIVERLKAAINYWRFRFCSNAKEKPKLEWWYCWTMPLGYLMHLRDKLKVE